MFYAYHCFFDFVLSLTSLEKPAISKESSKLIYVSIEVISFLTIINQLLTSNNVLQASAILFNVLFCSVIEIL